jgi:hypothetical protein
MVVLDMEHTSCGCKPQPTERTVIDWDQTPDHLMALVDEFVGFLADDDMAAAGRCLRDLCDLGNTYLLSAEWMRGLARLLRQKGMTDHALLMEVKFPDIAVG